MKIGIIADVHAEPEKLRAVLDALDDVDLLLCAGDLTGYGKYPNEVIEIIRAMDIPTVKGNHDSPSSDITPENADFLRNLPLEWSETIDGVRLYMCHGIPGVPFIGVTPKHFDEVRLISMLESVHADIMIAGHTHQSLLVELSGSRRFINPGAVCLGSYAVLSLPSCELTIKQLDDK